MGVAVKVTEDIARAMVAAGLDPDSLRARRGKKRAIEPLPAHCLLSPGPGPGRYEVKVRGWQPTRLNVLKGCHWAKAGRMKRADAEVIGGELRRAGVSAAIGKRRVGLVIVLGPGQRGGDGDAYWKSALDGLKRCGALKDDNRQWCELLAIQYERQSEMGTRIILEDF